MPSLQNKKTDRSNDVLFYGKKRGMIIIKQEGGKIISGASMKDVPNILWLEEIRKEDIVSVGGKGSFLVRWRPSVSRSESLRGYCSGLPKVFSRDRY